MERSPARARIVGAVVLLAVFVAGFMAGVAWRDRPRASSPVNVDVQLSTRLPRELTRLDLDATQEDSLRAVLRRGNARVRSVLAEIQPRMHAALDSVDAEVDAVLTPEQRARLRASRPERVDETVIDTTAGP